MIIREANMNDLENLLPLYIEGYMFHYEGRKDVFNAPNELILRDELIDNLCSPEQKIIVIVEEERICGYLLYKIKSKGKDHTLWIDQLVIAEESRNKGYATKLMKEIEKKAKETKAKRVELNCWAFNEGALELYKKLGFNPQRLVMEKDVIV